MPKLGQMLPYVLRRCRRATDGGACGASGITLVVRLAARVSNRSLTWHPPCSYSTLFHARWCATGAWGTGGEVTDRARGRPKGPHPAPHRSRPYGYERHFATSIALETSCAVVRRLQRVD